MNTVWIDRPQRVDLSLATGGHRVAHLFCYGIMQIFVPTNLDYISESS